MEPLRLHLVQSHFGTPSLPRTERRHHACIHASVGKRARSRPRPLGPFRSPGLSVSTDAGERFQPADGAPQLVLLTSNDDSVIDDTLWRKESGARWTVQGSTPEQVHAIAISGDDVIVGTAAGLRRTSDMGGRGDRSSLGVARRLCAA